MELSFVLASGQNAFFSELVEAVRDELDGLGVESSVHLDRFPEQEPGRVNVLVPPHEFFALRGHAISPERAPLERTLFVCAEQPRTHFFNLNVQLSARAGAVFDINPLSAAEMRIHNVKAQPLPLGWTRRWDGTPFDPERDLDVTFLGCWTPRRGRALASYAPVLSRRRCHIQMSDNSRPNPAQSASFVTGAEKRALLGRTKVLLNVHQDELPYLEWLRFVEAVLCGAVVVTEHSAHCHPFVPGEHFVGGSVESLGLLLDGLLDDPHQRLTIQTAAYEALRERPFADAVAALAEAAADVDARCPPRAEGASVRPSRLEPPEFGDGFAPPNVTEDPDASAVRRALKDLKLEVVGLRRELDELRRPGGAQAAGVIVDAATPAWQPAAPRVTVLVTSYCYADLLERALDSAARSTFDSLELVIVDDGSKDPSVGKARCWLRAHPTVPALLVRHSANRGLGCARNTGVDFARGELVFVLDADNAVYARGIELLVAALDADPGADFAYGLLEQFTSEGAFGLMGVLPWDPARLRAGNYIDAMALVRADTLRELRYTTDPRLHGYEDWDLWCAIAERGGHGVLVREIVARYRLAQHSMARTTSVLSLTDAFSVLAERHPKLMHGVRPPH